MKLALLSLIVCLVLASCSDDNNNPITDNGNQQPFAITNDTEYAVYRALIEQIYVIGWDKIPIVAGGTKLMVIESETYLDYNYPLDQANRPSSEFKVTVLPDTYNSFLHQNQRPQTIDSTKLALSVPCAIIDPEELYAIFTKNDQHPKDLWDNWDRFHEKYPGSYGIVQLSRVGFDTQGNQALVYVENDFHDLAAAGYYVLLVRKDDIWVPHDVAWLWVA